mmetsp:Transcript_104343/g.294913  ORF Transcript_104343/g.294913 Transcript_104343/m.294913 type:complete len:645 (-) Transcript_104343:32-1966(-)
MDCRSMRRLSAIARHVTFDNHTLRFPVVVTSSCIGESGNQSSGVGRDSQSLSRVPLKIVFEDHTAKHDRYGGSGDYVVLEGELLHGRAPSETVLLFMHPSGIMNLLPMPLALARAGMHVITGSCRYPNNDTCLIMEKVVLDLGAFVRHAKSKLGYKRVVLAGWSGGGSLAAFYQSEAEHPTVTHTPAGDPVDMAAAGLVPADALMFLAAHSSRARIFTEWLDPAVVNEQDPSQRNASLDIFHPDGPKPPFSPDFAAKYAEAQIARNRRITEWVRGRLAVLEAESASRDWRQRRRDEAFTVPCTQAALARVDALIDRNGRKVPESRVDALAELSEENHSPVGLARFSTLRSWLSQWSYDDARADALQCLKSISVPCFVLENGRDHLVLPSHSRSIFEAISHPRKKLHIEPEATHYYFGQPETLGSAVKSIESWLESEGLLPSANQEKPEPPLSVQELRDRFSSGRLPTKLEVHGLNHLALVCSDMQRTIEFVCGKLGMPLVKTMALPDGGQHFFFDAGNGSSLAYFWYPQAPRAAPGVSSPRMGDPQAKTAVGSINHAAWRIPNGTAKRYHRTLQERGVQVSPILYHDDSPTGFAPQFHDGVLFSSFYFRGPDGEFLEFTEQHRDFVDAERDLQHPPKTRWDMTQ